MDLVLGRGVRFSYLLNSKSSIISSKLLSLSCSRPQFYKYLQIQCLEKHLDKPLNHVHICTSILKDNQYTKILESGIHSSKINTVQYSTSSKSDFSSKSGSELPDKNGHASPAVGKPSIFQRMKQMTKDYWHILIPVHLVTSLGWVSAFYIAAKFGVDIAGILESLNLSERYLEMLRGSHAGHWAVTYALYKVFTPIRYTVTVGGTTFCIRYLNKWGYLKFKKDGKLFQSIKSAGERRSAYEKSNVLNKGDQPQSPKT